MTRAQAAERLELMADHLHALKGVAIPASAGLVENLRAVMRALREPDPAERARIVVTVEGGIVQSVETDAPAEVLVMDFDVEGCDAEDLKTTTDGDEFYAYGGIVEADIDPENVARCYKDAGR